MNFNELANSPLVLFLLIVAPLSLGLLKKRKYFWRIFATSESLVCLSGTLIKKITALPRPFVHNPSVLGVTTNVPQDYSFPSLHTALATLFAWILAFIWPRLSWLWFAILALVGISRIKLGLHYPIDVVAGFFLATIIFWLVYLVGKTHRAENWRHSANVRRKVVHLFYGSFLVLLIDYRFMTLPIFLVWLAFSLLLWLASPYLPPKIRLLIGYFERQKDKVYLADGPFFFTLSSFVAYIFFPPLIAMAAILNLAIGDSVNALTGSFFRLKNGKKRLEASLAAFFATLLISWQYLSLPVALAGSLVTMLFEFTEPKIGRKKIDDNLLIPFLSGLAMMAVEKVTGL